MLNIVLVEPEIPQNTGNIARTCAAINAKLHLVKPLGFEISDKTLKRAGLDYWDKLTIEYHESLEDFMNKYGDKDLYYLSTKGQKSYTDVDYSKMEDVYVLFGKETKGLPEDLLLAHMDTTVRIPMFGEIRSLNLSNSVAIVVYEILRQNNFEELKQISEYFK